MRFYRCQGAVRGARGDDAPCAECEEITRDEYLEAAADTYRIQMGEVVANFTATMRAAFGDDPEPQPGDGPEYHTDRAFWEIRQQGHRPDCAGITTELQAIHDRSHRAIHSQGRTIGDIERSAADVPQLLEWLGRALDLLQWPDFVKIPLFLAKFDKFRPMEWPTATATLRSPDNLGIAEGQLPVLCGYCGEPVTGVDTETIEPGRVKLKPCGHLLGYPD